MSSRYKVLSYPVNATTPMYGSAPQPLLTPYSQIAKGDASNSYIITVHNHTGTHIDAPKHFVENGRSISELLQNELIFKNPVIIDCPKDSATLISHADLQASSLLQVNDCLLLRTGFGQYRYEEKYRTHNPGIAPETILWIRRAYQNIRCIGIDSISISSFQNRNAGREAHKAAFMEMNGLSKPLFLIEDMDLEALSSHDILKKVIIIPWQINGIDSAPCIVLAEVI